MRPLFFLQISFILPGFGFANIVIVKIFVFLFYIRYLLKRDILCFVEGLG